MYTCPNREEFEVGQGDILKYLYKKYLGVCKYW